MAEIWFYHLTRAPLEKTLPTLVERTRARGWKAVIRSGSPERMAALDDLLWTYSDDSFLAHGVESEPDAASQPVLLTTRDGLPNGAEALFLVDNAPLPEAWPSERVIMLFDGHDPDAVEAARAAWKTAKGLGHGVQYWQQDESGRWERKG
jgi:DNA polymerase-3 subunit chi